MNVLFIALPKYPLLPPSGNKENCKISHKDFRQKKEILLSRFLFFCPYFFDFLYLSSFDVLEIVSKNPDVLLFDLSFCKELGKDYLNNYYRIISKIKEILPNLKIITLSEQKIEDIDTVFYKDLDKIIERKLEKKNKIIEEIKKNYDLCVIEDLKVYLKNIKKYKKEKIDYFYFTKYYSDINFSQLGDINYKINLKLEDLLKIDLSKLTKNGCVEIIANFYLNDSKIKEKIKEIKEINNKIKIKIEITLGDLENKKIIEILNLLDLEKINYSIKQNEITEIKQKILFTLIDDFKKNKKELEEIKNRISTEIYCVSKNTTIEEIMEAIFELNTDCIAIYLDLIHMLDGHFTIEEILDYLVKLHRKYTKEEMEKKIKKCLIFLEKKELITKNKDSSYKKINEKKYNVKFAFPQREELVLLYSGAEKGYFMLNTKLKTRSLEKISKEIFFFFLFSKGIYYIREIAEKMHCLFGDCVEFSKENYLKTTEKIYKTFKRYKLCK